MSCELQEHDSTVESQGKLERKLVCVLVPAVVRDVQRTLECLGGLDHLSAVYSRADGPDGRRLSMCLSPANPLAHSTFADATEGGGLLYRIRVRRHRTLPAQSRVVSVCLDGYVSRTYKFDCLLDFSLAPVNEGECIQEQVIPAGREPSSWINEPGPVLLPPPHFARSDRPLQYGYMDKKLEAAIKTDLQHHSKVRPDRSLNVVPAQFSLNGTLPNSASPVYVRYLHSKLTTDPMLHDKISTIEKALSERAVWSRSALQLHTKVDARSLRIILPARAMYMRTGPWRLLWIRLGYDPRLHPESRRYQTFDFRLRNLPEVSALRATHKNIGVERVRRSGRAEKWGEVVYENNVRFKPGVLPSQRQIYYQYCDIEVEEVQRLVEEGAAQTCDVTRGWLRPGVEKAVRTEVSRLTRITLHQLHGNTVPEDPATSSPASPE